MSGLLLFGEMKSRTEVNFKMHCSRRRLLQTEHRNSRSASLWRLLQHGGISWHRHWSAASNTRCRTAPYCPLINNVRRGDKEDFETSK